MAGTALVAGLGFMGGSLALALRAAGWRVRLWHHRDGVAAEAAAGGLGEPGALDGAWDVAIACAPVGALPGLCATLAGLGLATDVGSTKAALCAALAGPLAAGRFVGSHPMCGSHRTGWRHAEAGLYRDATVVVCAGHDRAQATVADLWRSLGCRVVAMAPAEHDRAVAVASHLPHLCAGLAAGGLAGADGSAVALAASGFRDTTRVAGGCPELWADILLDNRAEVLAAMRDARGRLDALAAALDAGDRAGVAAWLERARAGRARFDARRISPAGG